MSRVKKLSISALIIALAFLASKIKLFEFLFSYGGSITLFSMILLTLPGYFFSVKYGFLSSFCFSLLKLIFAGNIYSPFQAFFDYGLSYICFGLSGLKVFRINKYGLFLAYIVSVILRFIFSSLSGYLFFSEYTPESFNPIIYSMIYNGSYIFVEMILSIILLVALLKIPMVNRFIEKLKSY